jgi:hypothetical protein
MDAMPEPVHVPPWDDDDPYTMATQLCDDDGIVRRGAMHDGASYPCTGHAHFAGHHIRCMSPGHPEGLPAGLNELLRAPGWIPEVAAALSPKEPS